MVGRSKGDAAGPARQPPPPVPALQAISTRVDLLSKEYFEQIQLLQDRVPPFPCAEAYAAMERSFGMPLDRVFAAISDAPVAAASLCGRGLAGLAGPSGGAHCPFSVR